MHVQGIEKECHGPTADQQALRRAMMRPECYPHAVQTIERRETHISTVFLTGPFVYKVKKPLDLGFLDFSTLEKRRTCCRQEVALNRRLSQGVYVDVVPITRQDGRYRVDGPGAAVEFAVKMRQLDDADAMLPRLEAATLTDDDLQALVRRLVDFYASAATGEAGAATTVPAWEENLQCMDGFAGVWIDRRQYTFVRTATRAFARTHSALFQRRRLARHIRDGHGDLRTDHIYFTRDGIQIIDCIEFNAALRCVDVISDLAFLAMDLAAHRYAPTAAALIRTYVEATDDVGALLLLDFYRCYRAMVRCKVNCYRLAASGPADPTWDATRRSAARYLALAHHYAAACCRPTLWVVCGLPATGKSTIAGALAALGVIPVIRSDGVRKELFAEADESSAGSALDRGLYSPSATEATYERMLGRTDEMLKTRQSVVLDATFSRRAHRVQAVRMAAHRQARIVFVECRVDESIMADRLRRRETAPSLSDARLIHLEAFKKRFAPMEPLDGAVYVCVDTALPPQDCLREILFSTMLPAGSRMPASPLPAAAVTADGIG